MKKKYKFLCLIICLLSFSVALFGLNISILIVQNDGTEKVSVASKTFENEILNYFFDNLIFFTIYFYASFFLSVSFLQL